MGTPRIEGADWVLVGEEEGRDHHAWSFEGRRGYL